MLHRLPFHRRASPPFRHVAISHSSSGAVQIYWNGVLKASGTAWLAPHVYRPSRYIGKSNW